jgi:signal transduction histidine kinase
MIISSIIFILLQLTVAGASTIQIGNFILFIFNTLYSIIITALVIPTYKEHKLIMKDYEQRNSPQAKILADREAEVIKKYGSDIAEIKHSLNNLTNQLQVALKRKEDEPEWVDVLKAINKLNDRLDN